MSQITPREDSSDFIKSNYRSFLLRCWRETGTGPDDSAIWRFCLVNPGNQKNRKVFANLETLMAYLRQELDGG